MRLRLKTSHTSEVVIIDDDQLDVAIGAVINDQVLPQHPKLVNNDLNLKVVAIKAGFPVKPIDLSIKFKDSQVRSGDQLIVELGGGSGTEALIDTKQNAPTGAATKDVSKGATSSDIPSVYIEELQSYLILRNIPDDNACMFNAMSYALKGSEAYKPGGELTNDKLRAVVVNKIEGNPLYDEVTLGRPVDKYCEWIAKKDSWGGAIELGILAEHFNIKINCIDIELGNFIKFEVDEPKTFINLIYSGIHYDLLVTNPVLSATDKKNDQGNWDIDFESIIDSYSSKIATLLQSQNYSTNTTTFRVRCLNCYKILVGEMGASKHANETGHFSFGEVL